jgi:hypothetical protein
MQYESYDKQFSIKLIYKKSLLPKKIEMRGTTGLVEA